MVRKSISLHLKTRYVEPLKKYSVWQLTFHKIQEYGLQGNIIVNYANKIINTCNSTYCNTI